MTESEAPQIAYAAVYPFSLVSIPSVLDKLKVLRQDSRLTFMMKNCKHEAGQFELPQIINQLIGKSEAPVKDDKPEEPVKTKDISVIDISGLPNEVAGPLTALIARILF